jgi:hypothetical protein
MNEIKSGIDQPHASQTEIEALPTGSSLHPRVYTIVIGLAAWFVLAAWIFAGGGVSDYLLFIVSGFIGVCIGLTLILASVTTVEKLPTGEPPEGEPKQNRSAIGRGKVSAPGVGRSAASKRWCRFCYLSRPQPSA